MKTLREFLEESWNVSISGIPGKSGYAYDKWGKRGQVDAWKRHVKSIHRGATFKDEGEHTYAHHKGEQVGRYSHANHSSETKE